MLFWEPVAGIDGGEHIGKQNQRIYAAYLKLFDGQHHRSCSTGWASQSVHAGALLGVS